MHIRKKGVRRTEEVFDVDGKRIEVVEVRGRTFVRLMEMLVGSVLLYGQRGGVGEVDLSQYRGCKCERPGFSWEYCREVAPPSVPTI